MIWTNLALFRIKNERVNSAINFLKIPFSEQLIRLFRTKEEERDRENYIRCMNTSITNKKSSFCYSIDNYIIYSFL